MMIFIGILLVGLAYAWKKKALEWSERRLGDWAIRQFGNWGKPSYCQVAKSPIAAREP